MNIRTRIATVATALVIAAVPLGNTAANAATATHSVTGCGGTRVTSCIVTADNDEGHLVFRDSHKRYAVMHSGAQALRYLKRHHYRPCAEEDSAACYWDAANRGNDVGDSFIVIGGRAEGTGTLWYLGNLD